MIYTVLILNIVAHCCINRRGSILNPRIATLHCLERQTCIFSRSRIEKWRRKWKERDEDEEEYSRCYRNRNEMPQEFGNTLSAVHKQPLYIRHTQTTGLEASFAMLYYRHLYNERNLRTLLLSIPLNISIPSLTPYNPCYHF